MTLPPPQETDDAPPAESAGLPAPSTPDDSNNVNNPGAAATADPAAQQSPKEKPKYNCRRGAYLCFKLDGGGTLYLHWSEEIPDQALAYEIYSVIQCVCCSDATCMFL